VDFGCVKEVPPDFFELLRILANPEGRRDPPYSLMARLIWGEQTAVKKKEAEAVLHDAMELQHLIFPPAKDGKFKETAFGDPRFIRKLAGFGKRIISHKLIQPEWAFVKRAEFGLYNLLQLLDARIETERELQAVLDGANSTL
jgi:hypothetical protein